MLQLVNIILFVILGFVYFRTQPSKIPVLLTGEHNAIDVFLIKQ